MGVMKFSTSSFTGETSNRSIGTSFNIESTKIPSYAIISTSDSQLVSDFESNLRQIIANDTKKEPIGHRYGSRAEFNDVTFKSLTQPSDEQLLIAYDIEIDVLNNIEVVVIHNKTENKDELGPFFNYFRVLWKTFGNKDIEIRHQQLLDSMIKTLVMSMLPIWVTYNFVIILSIFANQVIEDVKQEKRDYMQTCNLRLINYWIATCAFDYMLWVVYGLSLILAMKISGTEIESLTSLLYAVFVSAIPVLLLTYCMSFLFDDPESGSSYLMLCLFIPMILFVVLAALLPGTLTDWVMSLYPIGCFYSVLANEHKAVPCIMSLFSIFIWSGVLTVIEYVRVNLKDDKTRQEYTKQKQLFNNRKAASMQTTEGIEFERNVLLSGPSSYVVRCLKVSRLFFDENRNPVPAVNDVSLGIKKGEVYGFLGANGAGKTTILKIITSDLPPSSGSVEINGKDISIEQYPRVVSICPQFNSHLTQEMTPQEHFYLYGALNGIDIEEVERDASKLCHMLDLDEHKDKLIKELNGGSERKTSLICSLITKADIILLDEPTSSLDPVARHRVHELIEEAKSSKTFLLCTQLLDEAESICDVISMMFGGVLYVHGTPQYLASRFGTELSIEILTNDDEDKLDDYISQSLPEAKLKAKRPQTRVYTMCSNNVTLGEIFKVLKEAITGNHGAKYFTCSSSSLEKVFLDMVAQAENRRFTDSSEFGADIEPILD